MDSTSSWQRVPPDVRRCVYGINVGAGTNTRVGCKSLDVSQDPFGHLDAISRAPGGIRVTGWSIDPDIATPIAVHAYSGSGRAGDGSPGASTIASIPRGDVARAHPSYDERHGYDVVVAAQSAGRQTVCTYGINNGPGDNPQLGCKAIDVSGDPFGSLDSVKRVRGGVQATGWSIDPGTGSAIAVHLYGGNGLPGGGPGAPTSANVTRTDVGAAYPNYGGRHGYSVFLPTGLKRQTFCAHGINNGPGSNPRLGCKTL